jgi:hypothetical protein
VTTGFHSMTRERPHRASAMWPPTGKTLYVRYLGVTARLEDPPRLLFTVMFCGFTDCANCPWNLPPPTLVKVPISAPVEVTYTFSVALVLVLVACAFKVCLETWYSASVTATLSAGVGGVPVTVRTAVCVAPPNVPETVTGVEALVAVVVTVKLALMLPAGMAIPVGTAAATLPLLNVTSAPPAGAGAFNVAVPVAEVPPATLAGLMVIAARDAPAVASTVRSALLVTPPAEAVIVTVVVVDTATVETAKVAEVEPAGIGTDAGTLAIAGIPLERAT